MAAFKHMVDMTRSDDEKTAAHLESMFPPTVNTPDVPPGLCLCLTESEMEKLELEADAEVGDLLHCNIMAKVTSVNKSDSGNGAKCRIEMAVIFMAVEDESDEVPGEDDEY